MSKGLFTLAILVCYFFQACSQPAQKKFTEEFLADSCRFSTTGRNSFFILEPGYQLILEGREDLPDRQAGGKNIRLVITVLNETRKVGNIETRVVEENESEDGKTIEISKNFVAICQQTGSVFYFGEDVDIYEDGKIVSHEGAWLAIEKNKAGILMPGTALIGARYYQEIAPGVAMDRAEVISLDETVETPAGKFIHCLKTEETNALKPKEKEFKWYAPGIGLVKEENLVLVKHGFLPR